MSGIDPRRVEEVFDGAAGLAPDEVGPYLDRACADDAALRGEVLALLEADRRAGDRAPESIAAHALVADAEAPPRSIGAFEVVRKLGEGGMGVVYEAYDARLDRRVAVKLVRVGDGHGSTALGKARLLKEARALAKVAHPNVVAIHEVGVQDDDVFVVMELVEGETLAGWKKRAPRTWRDILAMYVGAGRGLAAAHAAGVVHRDFKPDNVLVGDDGRPRVADFGLARAPLGTSASASASSVPPVPSPAVSSVLPGDHTLAGGVFGTPSYMSPEHFGGEANDPRSDQFSFAVALYRALFDAPPFAGKDFAELRYSVFTTPPAVPRPSDVPPRVVDAILRALAAKPDDRFATMNDLLAVFEGELSIDDERDSSRSRNKRRVAAAVLVITGAASGVGVAGSEGGAAPTASSLLWLALLALGILCILGVVFRRMLVESAYNRRVALIFVLPVIGFVVHRALGIRLGTRVEDLLIADAISVGVLLAFAGLTIERWMGLGTVLALAYAAIATSFPARAAPGFATLLCLLAALPVIFWKAPGRSTTPAKKIASRVGLGGGSAD